MNASWMQRKFELRGRGTTWFRELIAGLTTFSAMAYILAVHPATLEAAGMDRAALVSVTALALIVIGLMMLEGLKDLKWESWEEAFPAFLTMVTMPLAFSISEGIAMGFVVFATLKIGSGRAREVSGVTLLLAAVFLVHYLWPG